MSVPAVFLDRDGVLNASIVKEGKFYSPQNMAEFHVYEAAKEPLCRLAFNGFLLIVITNQPDVSRQLLSLENLNAMHAKMVSVLGGPQVIRDIFFCPHTAENDCDCRKPKPGLLQAAALKWPVDFSRSYFIGDRDVDMLAAQSVGCQRVLLGYDYNQNVGCDYRAADIDAAANWILSKQGNL